MVNVFLCSGVEGKECLVKWRNKLSPGRPVGQTHHTLHCFYVGRVCCTKALVYQGRLVFIHLDNAVRSHFYHEAESVLFLLCFIHLCIYGMYFISVCIITSCCESSPSSLWALKLRNVTIFQGSVNSCIFLSTFHGLLPQVHSVPLRPVCEQRVILRHPKS